jgi:hypothetical protein
MGMKGREEGGRSVANARWGTSCGDGAAKPRAAGAFAVKRREEFSSNAFAIGRKRRRLGKLWRLDYLSEFSGF